MTLIIGGAGQLGTALRRILPGSVDPRRAELNLEAVSTIREQVRALAPDRVINCAAYTAVDAAESEPARAEAINTHAVAELARAAGDLDVPFVTFSTDYVFDGDTNDDYTESSEPNPRSVYGRTKFDGEKAALGYRGSLVIRTSWLLSETHHNFVAAILARAVAGTVDVVDDQWGRPTIAADLARATVAALDSGLTGILHLASPPTTSWFGLAQAACELAGLAPDLVQPCSSDSLDRAAPRPRRAVLATERSVAMPSWVDGLGGVVSAQLGRARDPSHPASREH